MTLGPRTPMDHPSEPLSASYVNINDDVLSTTSDDTDAQTASLSGGEDTPDDVRSLPDTDFDGEGDDGVVTPAASIRTNVEDDDEDDEDDQDHVVEPTPLDASINDNFSMQSTITSGSVDPARSDYRTVPGFKLGLHEQLVSPKRFEKTYWLRDYPQLERFGCPQVEVTIQQCITNLKPDMSEFAFGSDPFTVLLTGHIHSSVAEAIKGKIMTALLPLLPEDCAVEFVVQSGNFEYPHLNLGLVIFFHHPHDQAVENVEQAKNVVLRCDLEGLPIIHIADPHLNVQSPSAPPLPAFVYNPRGLHTRVSNPAQEPSEANILQANPVDLRIFLKIGNKVLSQHLASLLGSCLGSLPDTEVEPKFKGKMLQSWHDIKKRPRRWSWWFLTLLPVFLLLARTMLMAVFPTSNWIGLVDTSLASPSERLPQVSTGSVLSQSKLKPTSVLEKIVPLVSIVPTSNVARPSTSTTMSGSISTTESPSWKAVGIPMVPDKFLPVKNVSKTFKYEALPSGVIIVTPPEFFIKRRNPPTLNVEATKNGQSLAVEISKLENGAYALTIPRRAAHGNVTVRVWTDKKPKLEDKAEIALGSRWTQQGGVHDALADIVAVAKEQQARIMASVAENVGVAQKRLQETSQVVSERSEQIIKQLQTSSHAMAEQAAEMLKKVDLAKLKDFEPSMKNKRRLGKARREARKLWRTIKREQKQVRRNAEKAEKARVPAKKISDFWRRKRGCKVQRARR